MMKPFSIFYGTKRTTIQGANEIKETVEEWTGIKVSIGVAPTKVLAKVANQVIEKR